MSSQPPPTNRKGGKRLRPPQRILRLLALLAALLAVVLVVLVRDSLPSAESAGYPAIFILSFMSSASVLVPLPGIAAVCVGGTVLVPLLVGIISGVGEALGETTGYLAGYSGRAIVEHDRRYQRIQPWMQRRGWLLLFLFSSIPNPLFDVVGLAAGVARIPLWQFYGSVAAGKILKSTVVAYGCRLGYDFFRMLGDAPG